MLSGCVARDADWQTNRISLELACYSATYIHTVPRSFETLAHTYSMKIIASPDTVSVVLSCELLSITNHIASIRRLHCAVQHCSTVPC